MKPKFKPGDVIIYGEGRWAPPSNGIVNRVGEGGIIYLMAFQHFTRHYNGEWYVCDNAVLDDDGSRLHPDQDAVWADFCKWRLTNA